MTVDELGKFQRAVGRACKTLVRAAGIAEAAGEEGAAEDLLQVAEELRRIGVVPVVVGELPVAVPRHCA